EESSGIRFTEVASGLSGTLIAQSRRINLRFLRSSGVSLHSSEASSGRWPLHKRLSATENFSYQVKMSISALGLGTTGSWAYVDIAFHCRILSSSKKRSAPLHSLWEAS